MAKAKVSKSNTAYTELCNFIGKNEHIEGIVFGPWTNGDVPDDGKNWTLGYGEPSPPPVPFEKRGILLTLRQAKGYMDGWTFSGFWGSCACYATYIWTSERVICVTQYDGATGLTSMPRHPIAVMPDMPP
jgi:hypothetical protein